MNRENLNEIQSSTKVERLISALAGSTLAFYAFRSLKNRRRKPIAGFTMALGAGMMFNSTLSGKSPIHPLLMKSAKRVRPLSASVEHGKGIRVERAITVKRSAEEMYHFWRDFENIPRFFKHVDSVATLEFNRTHWVAKGPAGTSVEWDAIVHNDIPNRLIAWRTIGNSDVSHAGSVEFKPLAEDRGCVVKVMLNYEPPGGKLGDAISRVFGENPEQQLEEDLQRFKQIMD